ncbi:MAG: pyrroline-5-carboxylate reductase [Alphaproteobacteria bacterium]|nr:pyrroline-5-carboxylate reductase [Alphaproteobacteria bacterium]
MPWRYIRNVHIALIGCGKMGAALAEAWDNSRLTSRIDIVEPSDLPISSPHMHHFRQIADMAEARMTPDIVVIAVKPALVSKVCDQLARFLPDSVPVVSIAAGMTLGTLQKSFPAGQPLIRAMPNTPARIGKGITVAVTKPDIFVTQMHLAHAALAPTGAVEWVEDESLMDAVTAVSGSGPAYIFYMIECLVKAGLEAGLPHELASRLARQTMIGAGALAEADSHTPPDILRQNVTSPGGTTEAGLSVLMDGRWQKILQDSVIKAQTRSRELSH